MRLKRLLFASFHCYLDPGSGAAICTRDVLEMLAARGVDCRVLSTGLLDFEDETPLDEVLDPLGVPYARREVVLGDQRATEVVDLTLSRVRITIVPTASSRFEQAPSPDEARIWLELADQVFERFRPQVVLTYGGHPASVAMIEHAHRRKIPVVFHLHNFAYDNPRPFACVQGLITPSEYTRRHYRRLLGLESTVLPDPVRTERAVAHDREPKYVTFVNPQPTKGATVFARIAHELAQKRPDIPLLVVEGRSQADRLAYVGLDLSELENLFRMTTTPDPRDIYRVSRIVLMPSLWRETLGRVAMEALANGIPVLASDRGSLPETLGDAGFVFTLPERCTPTSGAIPTPHEVSPWVAAIERLWDDAEWAQKHSELARREAERWSEARLVKAYRDYFEGFLAADSST